LGIAPEVEITAAIAGWTAMLYRDHQAVHHTDVISGATTYRVFLLASTLQVDIAFTPATEFGPTRRRSGCCSVPQPTSRCHRCLQRPR